MAKNRKLVFIHKDGNATPKHCMHCGEVLVERGTIIRPTFKNIGIYFQDHKFHCEACNVGMTFEYQVRKDKVTTENTL